MTESWLHLTVHTSAACLDAVANFLIERGSSGVVLKRRAVEAYFPNNRDAEALKRAVRRFVLDVVKLQGRSSKPRFGVGVSSSYTFGSMRADTEVIFDAIVALLLVMAVLMALVGGLGLMGAMSINVLERTREIGVLRAIGAPNRGVAQVFILEGVAIGVMSWLLGSLLAIPIGQGLGLAIGTAIMGVPLTFSYSLSGLWLWFVIVILLSALASFIPARNASRLTVREVLAYE